MIQFHPLKSKLYIQPDAGDHTIYYIGGVNSLSFSDNNSGEYLDEIGWKEINDNDQDPQLYSRPMHYKNRFEISASLFTTNNQLKIFELLGIPSQAGDSTLRKNMLSYDNPYRHFYLITEGPRSMSFGNQSLKNLKFEAAVGGVPTISASYEGLNRIESESIQNPSVVGPTNSPNVGPIDSQNLAIIKPSGIYTDEYPNFSRFSFDMKIQSSENYRLGEKFPATSTDEYAEYSVRISTLKEDETFNAQTMVDSKSFKVYFQTCSGAKWAFDFVNIKYISSSMSIDKGIPFIDHEFVGTMEKLGNLSSGQRNAISGVYLLKDPF